MHKKIKAELVSLAHSILQLENSDDISALHEKAQGIYEKLSVLKFVDAYINSESNSLEITNKIVDKIEPSFEEEKEVSSNLIEVIEDVEKLEMLLDEQIEGVLDIENSILKDDEKEVFSVLNSLEEELKDAISADVATEMFERVTKENPKIEEVPENTQRSLNDTLFKNNIQVGLNDRIAFVKHLFENNQEDFNRVLSQLNSFKNEEEAKDFIKKMVKPDYDWSAKQDYEERLINLIERKFL
ncbi:hypothetical protein [uncultured Lutibacter sp.]|uniref:hypothetical protein n=1 Tax=uncultured Lutibacter sp. TaxID=437739 RepID=UPI0026127B0F|nr:hypothetical protein [uncultured Lutibacter sp.]